jgi:hypothetical protein
MGGRTAPVQSLKIGPKNLPTTENQHLFNTRDGDKISYSHRRDIQFDTV